MASGTSGFGTADWRASPLGWGVLTFAFVLIAAYFGAHPRVEALQLVWPASGVAAGMLVLARRGGIMPAAVGLAVALAFEGIIEGQPLVHLAWRVSGSLVEALVFSRLFTKFVGDSPVLDKVDKAMVFVGLCVLAAAAGGLVARGGLSLGGLLYDDTFANAWWAWVRPHSLGLLMMTPAFLVTSIPSVQLGLADVGDFISAVIISATMLIVGGALVPETSVLMLLALVLAAPAFWWTLKKATVRRAALIVLIAGVVSTWLAHDDLVATADATGFTSTLLALAAVALLIGSAWGTEQQLERRHQHFSDASGTVGRAWFMLVPIMLFAAFAWWVWRGVVTEANQRIAQVTGALTTHAQRVIEVQEGMLQATLSSIQGRPGQSLAQDRHLFEMLRALEAESQTCLGMAVIDTTTGRLLATSTQFPAPNVNASHREYVEALRSGAPSTVIGKTILSSASQRVGFTVSRRDPASHVAVVSLVDRGEFERFFAGQSDSAGDVMMLFLEGGDVLAELPDRGNPLTERLLPTSLPMALAQHGTTAPQAAPGRDGARRLFAVRKVVGYPVYVAYGLSINAMHRAWIGQTLPFAVLCLLAGLLLQRLAGRLASATSLAEAARGEARIERAISEATRRHAEQLRQSEEASARLAAIVTSSSDAILSKSLDGTITTWNTAATRLLGFTAAEMIGQSIRRVIPADRQAEEDEIVARMMAGLNVDRYETVRCRKDGTTLDVSVNISPIRDAAGRITGASKIVRDISTRKAAEAALAASERRFRSTFENAAVGIAHVAPDGRWLRVNARFSEITGYSEAELTAITIQDITHPADMPADRQHMARMLSGESDSYVLEKRYIRKDRSVVWIELTVGCLRDANGSLEYFISVIEDISERKRTAAALIESERRFRGVFDHAGTGIAIATFNGRIEQCNAAYAGMLGYQPEDLVGQHIQDLFHPEDRPSNLAQLERLTAGEIDTFEITNRSLRRDGEAVWVHRRVSSLSDRDGQPTHLLALVTDMTEHRRSEERQNILVRELAHRGKNLLAVIQSIANRSFSGNVSLAEARRSFQGRLQALARTYGHLTDETVDGAELRDVIRGELEAFAQRSTIEGPPILLSSKVAQTMALVMHELATNAIKYGALSAADGIVNVGWDVGGEALAPRLTLTWHERGGPRVEPTDRRGFGTALVTTVAGAEFRCRPELTYGPEGVSYRIDGPLANFGRLNLRSPIRPRINSPALLALFDAWTEVKGHSSAPPPFTRFDAARLANGRNVSIVEVSPAGVCTVIEAGSAVTDGQPRPFDADWQISAASDTASIAYQRCARGQKPSYETARFDFGQGQPVTYERLLVPYLRDDGSTSVVVELVVLGTGLQKPQTPRRD